MLPYDFGVSTNNGRTFATMSLLFYYVPDSGDLINRAKFDANLADELRERIKNGFIIADYRQELKFNYRKSPYLVLGTTIV